eukprot:30980-Pelagococcus_subviridis.AAC.11
MTEIISGTDSTRSPHARAHHTIRRMHRALLIAGTAAPLAPLPRPSSSLRARRAFNKPLSRASAVLGSDPSWPGLSEVEVNRARAETPAYCDDGDVAHFNSAGSSPPPKPVLDAQLEYLAVEANLGGYETAELSKRELRRPYAELATMLGCERDEIAITQSATSAWQLAFSSLERTFARGDRVLVARAEYASNYIAYLQASERTGVVVEVIPSDAYGQVDADALDATLSDASKGKCRLVSIVHVPTSSGLVNDAVAIGAVAKKHGVPYLLDACQSVGQMPVNVNEIGCDFLCGTGRKYLRGPRGIGFLYARGETVEAMNLVPAYMDLHGATWEETETYEPAEGAKRFEQYEVSFAAKVGLGAAVAYANAIGVDAGWRRTRYLAETLRVGLRDVKRVVVHDQGEVQCGIVTFTVGGVSPFDVRRRLARDGVKVWTSNVKNNTKLEHEREEGTPEVVVRASVHYFNTEEEIGRLIASAGGARLGKNPDIVTSTLRFLYSLFLLLEASTSSTRKKKD